MKYHISKNRIKSFVILVLLTFNVGRILANSPTKTLVYEKKTYNLLDHSRIIDTVQFVVDVSDNIPKPVIIQVDLKNENPFAGLQYLMYGQLIIRPTDCSFGILHGGDKFTFYYDEDLKVLHPINEESGNPLPVPSKIIAVPHNKHIEYSLKE